MAPAAVNDQRSKHRSLPAWAWLAGLLVFTLIVRGGVLWAMRDNLRQDPDAYREIAENLLRHGEFALGKDDPANVQPPRPTAYRPPLYPVVLSNLPSAGGRQISRAKVAALHLLLGVATAWLTWLTARRLLCRVEPASAARAGPPESGAGGGPALAKASLSHPTIAPLLAGVLVVCDPILLNQQTLVMTETLAAFLAMLSLWCLARFDANRSWFNAALAGGAIGLAILCRPTFLPWLGLVVMVLIFVRRKNSKFRIQNSQSSLLGDFGWRLGNLAGLVIVAAGVLSPWAIRNYRVFGKPIVTTTHGGYTLLLGNNQWFIDWIVTDREGLPWTPPAYDRHLLNRVDIRARSSGSPSGASFSVAEELAMDKLNYERAYHMIHRHPWGFSRACIYRVRQLWSPLPHRLTADESLARRSLRYVTAAWYCGVYLLAAVGIWGLVRQRGTPQRAFPTALFQPPWVWGVLLCLAFTAVHTFYWTNLRMRAPLMPFVALLAAAAVGSGPRRHA
jgi:hypothetical protein